MRRQLVVWSLVLALMAIAPPAARGANEPEVPTLGSFPLAAPEVVIRDTWGARRPGGRRHRGIDVLAPLRTQVLAAADGVVVRRKWNRWSGWYLEIDHGGWSTLYLHLDGLSPAEGGDGAEAFVGGLEVGSKVVAGQTIGFVGATGNASVPHLHFEVRVAGTRLDAYHELTAARVRQLRLYERADELD